MVLFRSVKHTWHIMKHEIKVTNNTANLEYTALRLNIGAFRLARRSDAVAATLLLLQL